MIKIRDVIRDNRDREGIIVERVERPTEAWIRDQEDRRVATLSVNERWWRMLPFIGGSVIVPESLAARLRDATYDDVMKAVDGGNEHARRTIAFVFPDILAAVHRRALINVANQSLDRTLASGTSPAEQEPRLR